MTDKKREKRKKRKKFRLRQGVFCIWIVLAAAIVMLVFFRMPVLQIYSSAMSPTLQEGELVLTVKTAELEQGDLAAFYVGNKLLIRRCIAGPGQLVNIDTAGNVYVDGIWQEETYLTEKEFGNCNIELPYQVPENAYFCMGDSRSIAVDSRHKEVGCVTAEQLVGKLIFRIWPFSAIGTLR